MNSLQVKEAITKWKTENHYWFHCNVLQAISHARKHNGEIRRDTTVYISDEDVYEINRRFENKNVKFLALAILAYAKATADKYGVCNISMVGLATWLDLDYTSVKRWLNVMIEYAYLVKINVPKREGQIRNPVTQIRMLVPLKNDGRYVVHGNDIAALANELFG